MLYLIKNAKCFTPEYIGKCDIVICDSKIYKIQENIQNTDIFEKVFDAGGLFAFPGFIDQHVHITGGGGEDGFSTHIKEISLDEILRAGVTTLVGVLGADYITRSPKSLYAKAHSLAQQGMSTYIYTGAYSVPPVTLTKDVINDMVFIDKVIGVGEIAISDHRSSNPSLDALSNIAAEVHLGGLLASKAGVMHFHIGDGKMGLKPVCDLATSLDLPIEMFVPTHVNRNKKLLCEAVSFSRQGGYIDLTAGENDGVSIKDSIKFLKENNVNLNKVTISSDAGGSCPGGEVGEISNIYTDIISLITDNIIDTQTAIGFVTKNVASLLKLHPKKGVLAAGADADILLTDKNFEIKKLFCMGKLLGEF